MAQFPFCPPPTVAGDEPSLEGSTGRDRQRKEAKMFSVVLIVKLDKFALERAYLAIDGGDIRAERVPPWSIITDAAHECHCRFQHTNGAITLASHVSTFAYFIIGSVSHGSTSYMPHFLQTFTFSPVIQPFSMGGFQK
jgi:hypothetical protein